MSLFGRRSGDSTTLTPKNTVALVRDDGPANDRVSLEKRGAGVDLLKRYDKAGVSLSKRGLSGVRTEALLLLDHSMSMDRDYRDGLVQQLVERALGFALQVDGDGVIPVIPFDSGVGAEVNVTVENYAGIVDRELYRPSKMGSTNLTAALKEVEVLAEKTQAPLFVIVVTDGSPDDRRSATAAVRRLSQYAVFLKFLAIRPVDYLQELDDMDGRLVDNADAKFLSNPSGVSDLEFAEAMVDEWDSWITAAQTAGLLR
ncbi:von Willebrand factor type A domain (plasmid) [Tsukamurella tyrosinosolvens]|uniref:TerF vWA domain-containing protein n=1 Tax=Tsukamurella tyrosinosolvens TaxID=57704 RepID=A0A1H4VM97_TSUTY|nr:VWA domain-containing protein [Tsukamurella tyrosinosolvens]KXO90938.1 hypothetical protein AXK58_21125 [Tsukamurella tyrosinosolvens]SEC82146.1 TerF vWA domain-containing protein [Tsukamurella tyrosinosolvens]VEH90426.1 von Willebrand factor type A domain [Tsukamurella tyrosinosolvens]